jgi:hypothetical protein
VPETWNKISSGHFFPFSESYDELEASLLLSLFGFYRYALAGLRTSLELSVVGVFYDRNDDSESKIQRWFHSDERTPQFKSMLEELPTVPGYDTFCKITNFKDALQKNYDALGGFIHVRGFSYSSLRLSSSSVVQFSEESLRTFIHFFCEIAHISVILILLKYPIGVQPVPLFTKFGLDGPAGGFLDEGTWAVVRKILTEWEYSLLSGISDADSGVQRLVEEIENMPDLTPEQLEQQVRDWEDRKRVLGIRTKDAQNRPKGATNNESEMGL